MSAQAKKQAKRRVKTPILIALDMSKSREHEHPDISAKKTYLCLIHGEFFCGKFDRQWYGWNFNGWHDGLQFDAPGWNSSGWQQIWELKR